MTHALCADGETPDWILVNLDGDGHSARKDNIADLSASEFAADRDFILGA